MLMLYVLDIFRIGIGIYLLLLQFLENKFVVMLFHYDGMVDEWKNLEWSSRVIHISATNQTKW